MDSTVAAIRISNQTKSGKIRISFAILFCQQTSKMFDSFCMNRWMAVTQFEGIVHFASVD